MVEMADRGPPALRATGHRAARGVRVQDQGDRLHDDRPGELPVPSHRRVQHREREESRWGADPVDHRPRGHLEG